MFVSISLLLFSCSVVSDSCRPHGQQDTRLPCLLPTRGSYSNSCPSRQWLHPTISSSVVPFSSCLQSFPASGSFPMSWFFSSVGPKYCRFSFSIRPSNEYSGLICSRMDWLDLPAVQGTLKSFPTPQLKSINSSAFSFLYSPPLTSIHDYWKKTKLWLDRHLLVK